MNEAFWESLPWMIAAAGLFSFLAVATWSAERRREREAYYKSDAIKKIAEMQGNAPDSVLQLLREALTPSSAPSPWVASPRALAAYYRSETLKEIARMPNAGAAMEILREQERNAAVRIRSGLRLGGLITAAVGIGLMPFLRVIVPDVPVYLVGMIPLLVGVSLLAYSYVLAPKP
jgi:hypothetical protein